MAIDVQNQQLVMQVYNYNSAGQPTFHLASGPLVDGKFQGPLKQYRGGRSFGSGERIGQEDQSAGNVFIRFDSSTTGFVQFPGEPEVAMSRFRFDGIPAGSLLKPNFRESWIVLEYAEDGTARFPWKIEIYKDPNNGGIESLAVLGSGFGESSLFASNPCSLMQREGWFRCDVIFQDVSGLKNKIIFEIHKMLSGLEGYMTRVGSPSKQVKLLGSKYSSYNTSNLVAFRMADIQRDQINNYGGRLYESGMSMYVPEPGTWVVSQELNGKPGRGMAIDVQNDTLVMQVYNYEDGGDPTFHLAVGQLNYFAFDGLNRNKNSAFASQLKKYAGGRYFGSKALNAREVGDAGRVHLNFESPLKGWVKFPGEDWVAIEKFQFGYGQKNPEALLGTWSFGVNDDWDYVVSLNKVDGKVARGDFASCQYSEENYNSYMEYNESVFCILNVSSQSFLFVTFDATPEVRAVPAAFREIFSASFPGKVNKGFAVQVRDKNGVDLGLSYLDR